MFVIYADYQLLQVDDMSFLLVTVILDHYPLHGGHLRAWQKISWRRNYQ